MLYVPIRYFQYEEFFKHQFLFNLMKFKLNSISGFRFSGLYFAQKPLVNGYNFYFGS